jgi:hypothetical protein
VSINTLFIAQLAAADAAAAHFVLCILRWDFRLNCSRQQQFYDVGECKIAVCNVRGSKLASYECVCAVNKADARPGHYLPQVLFGPKAKQLYVCVDCEACSEWAAVSNLKYTVCKVSAAVWKV